MQHKQLERLLLFTEVAEQLSFVKAAESLGISKGYLSEQVKKLEQEYATPLLVRTTRSVRLTTEGQKALESGREIKYLANNLHQNLHKLDGCIRITAPRMFAETCLAPVLQSFRQLYPEVTFEINTSYTSYNLHQSHFDMAFRATRGLPPENMVAKKLFDYQHIVAASPEYLAKYKAPITPNDLINHQCLTSETRTSWPFNSEEISITGSIACNDNQLLKQLALKGEGIVRLPSYYLQDEINNHKLVPLLQSHYVSEFDIHLLYPTTTRETARLRQFTSFVTGYFNTNSINKLSS